MDFGIPAERLADVKRARKLKEAREDKRDKTTMEIALCNAPKMARGYFRDLEKECCINGAIVEDDEGWGIITGAEFGCVLHEDKT